MLDKIPNPAFEKTKYLKAKRKLKEKEEIDQNEYEEIRDAGTYDSVSDWSCIDKWICSGT